MKHSLFSILLLSAPGLLASESDWTRLGGPNSDYRVPGVELSTDWPDGGPQRLWVRPLGPGYSGITVAGDRLFTVYRKDDSETVVAISTADGSTIWQHTYAAPYADSMRMEHGSGPHATPLYLDGRVFVTGIRGVLHAFDAESGEVAWKKELVADLGGTNLDRGYSASAFPYANNIILPIGGKGQGLAAFDRQTGEIAWKSLDFESTYSTPILIDVDGQDQLALFVPNEIMGIDPTNGQLLWRHAHPTSYGLNISVPAWDPATNTLVASSGYNGGTRALRLQQSNGETTVRELWASNQMRLHISNSIVEDGMIYATSGDFGAILPTALRLETGEVAWKDRSFTRANMLLADGKFVLLDEDGVLGLATPGAESLEVHAKFALFDTKCWAPPTLVGNTLYARDEQKLVALRLP